MSKIVTGFLGFTVSESSKHPAAAGRQNANRWGQAMAVGYGLMTGTTPTEKQLYDRMSPELRRKIDEARTTPEGRQQRQAQLDYLKDIAQSDKPIWQRDSLDPNIKRQL